MKNFLKFSFFLAAILFSFFGSGQTRENLVKASIPVFRQVSNPALPTIETSLIFFSKDGLLWFSSLQGLTSFDGSGVVFHSNLKETNEYGLNNIYSIAEDKDHNFYLATSQGTLFFDRQKKLFSSLKYTYSHTGDTTTINTKTIYIDKDETVYSGTNSQGLFIHYPATGKTEHVNLDSSRPDKWNDRYYNTIFSFLEYPGNNSLLWVGTFNGIYLFDKKTKQFTRNFTVVDSIYDNIGNALPYYDVQEMDMANDSTIWFNVWTGGFAKYNTHTGQCFIYTTVKNRKTGKGMGAYIIPTFARISDGFYLLGIAHRKPAVFDTKEKTMTFFSVTADTLINDAIRCVKRDANGNLWVIRNGILYVSMPGYSRLQNKKFNLHYSANYISELRGIYFDTISHQYYCAARMSTGVHVLDSNFNAIKIIPTPLFTNYYTFNKTCTDRITRDGSGRFWTTGWETYIMLPGQEKFEHVGKRLPLLAWIERKGEFDDMVSTRRGDILLREANTGTVYLVDYKNLHTDTIRVPVFLNPSHGRIADSKLCYDGLRNVIYLSNNDGIAQFDLDKKVCRHIPYREIFGTAASNQLILRFATSNDGRIWLLEDKYGIRIIDPESLRCNDSIPFGTRGLMQGYFNSIGNGGNDCMILRSLNGVVIYSYNRKHSFLFDNANGLYYPDYRDLLYCNFHMVAALYNTIAYYDIRQLNNNDFHPIPSLNVVMSGTLPVFTKESGENKDVKLSHDKNTLTLSFSAPEFIFPERIEYSYRLDGVNNEWQYTGYFNRNVTYTNLSPGKYVFHLKAQMQGGSWEDEAVDYTIIIKPAFWQTAWFRTLIILLSAGLLFLAIRYRIKSVRREEKIKGNYEKELLQLEAKALRAQMNPHFIFNCLNSIKSLIQQHNEEKSVIYLTTFSKLIRTLFNNADKKEISLYDEVETCNLYLQLEAMRLDAKFKYSINLDHEIDLKSILVPALIIQPLIENAIWHGIVPKDNTGRVDLNVTRDNGNIEIAIDDDGIGREASKLNKAKANIGHQSKGVNLTRSRLEIDNLLQQREARLVIIDKKDKEGKTAGTKVVLSFPEF
jgi:ligand-binding sensor domain-containing protein/two-component sensor histidine kinase